MATSNARAVCPLAEASEHKNNTITTACLPIINGSFCAKIAKKTDNPCYLLPVLGINRQSIGINGMKKMATARQEVRCILQKIAIFVLNDIHAKRNRIDLFSRVKSGKFFEDENKSTFPNHTHTMAWAVAYFSPRVYQSLHDEISLQLTSSFVSLCDRIVADAGRVLCLQYPVLSHRLRIY